MGRKEITTKEDLMKVIELFENTGITYWLDGGWGVDILAGKPAPGFPQWSYSVRCPSSGPGTPGRSTWHACAPAERKCPARPG